MDHHCPWVNNCVGFYNYKFFVLFITWTSITAMITAACLLSKILSFFSGGQSDMLIVAAFVVTILFGLVLAVFVGTHYIYALNNQTTIEVMEKQSKRKENIFHLGAYENFKQVFGPNPWLWFVPVFTTVGHGLWFTQKQSTENGSLIM